MKSRHSLAIIIGTLGIYFLVNAGMSAYAIYLAKAALKTPILGEDIYLSDLRTNYGTVLVGLTVFTIFVLLSVASSVGFLRNAKWGPRLWLATSAAVVLCMIFAGVALNASWQSHYLYIFTVVGLSWWYLRGAKKDPK